MVRTAALARGGSPRMRHARSASRLRHPASLLSLLAVAATAPAQAAPGAGFAFLTVRDGHGEPLAGAVVTFAGTVPHLGNAAAPDIAAVASDARGRARARLRPGVAYVAWAVGPADAAGRQAVSQVRGLFGAGTLAELVCDEVQMPRTVVVQGHAAWEERCGPLRFFVVTPVPGTSSELTCDDAGQLVLPPGPGGVLEVRSGDGQPLWSGSPSGATVQLPPPQRVSVRTVDPRGNAVAGVPIQLRVARREPWRFDQLGFAVEERLRLVGCTDAAGELAFDVPYDVDPMLRLAKSDLPLIAAPPGRPAVVGGILNNSHMQDDQRVVSFTGGAIRFTIRDSDALVGNCGCLPPGAQAVLWAVCKQNRDRGDTFYVPRQFVAAIGEDGRFAFDELPLGVHSSRLSVVAADGRTPLAVFAARADRALPEAVSGEAPRAPFGGAIVASELRVLDPGSGPASGYVGWLAPDRVSSVLTRDQAVRVVLDAAGTARLPLEAGAWVALFHGDAGWRLEHFTVSEKEPRRTLQLEPCARMTLRLVDGDGQPVPGVGVGGTRSGTRGSSDPGERLLQALAARLDQPWRARVSDAAGRLILDFVPVPGRTLEFSLRGKGQGQMMELAANDRPLEVRVK